LHLSTVRAHLDVLIGANLVDSHAEVRTTPGRPRRFYEATAEATDAAETGGYRLLAEILVSHLSGTSDDVRRDAIAAGRAWGTYFVERPPPYTRMPRDNARRQVLLLLDRLGFQPELDDDGERILIRRCPFLDVARRHQDVVCSLHLGIMQGALETLGASVEARDLEPFVQPSLCVAHLTDIEDQR
jgi:predicted ArsR family transcriptional regulator